MNKILDPLLSFNKFLPRPSFDNCGIVMESAASTSKVWGNLFSIGGMRLRFLVGKAIKLCKSSKQSDLGIQGK